jgi:putative hydrolase of the HAD superfamily
MQLDQPQAIRTIFFDVGFTLIHPYPLDLEIGQQVCGHLGLHIHLERVKDRLPDAQNFYLQQVRANSHVWASEASINELWITYYINLLRPLVEEQDEKRLRQLADTIYHEYCSHRSWQIYADVVPTLEVLRASRKYTLGAISDWGGSLGPILQRLRLNDYFDCLLISALTRHAKPAPALYETALERANTVADYAIHIGDSYTLDVLGARAVGMTPVLLDRNYELTSDQVDCLLIHSVSDVLSLLEVER